MLKSRNRLDRNAIAEFIIIYSGCASRKTMNFNYAFFNKSSLDENMAK